MRDWERDMVEPCLLAREIEVALDIEAVSFTFMIVAVQVQAISISLSVLRHWLDYVIHIMRTREKVNVNVSAIFFFPRFTHLYPDSTCSHELATAKPRHLSCRNAGYLLAFHLLSISPSHPSIRVMSQLRERFHLMTHRSSTMSE
jgi:hypothetical protein